MCHRTYLGRLTSKVEKAGGILYCKMCGIIDDRNSIRRSLLFSNNIGDNLSVIAAAEDRINPEVRERRIKTCQSDTDAIVVRFISCSTTVERGKIYKI